MRVGGRTAQRAHLMLMEHNLNLPRSRARSRLPIRRSMLPGGAYAPYRGPRVCKSRSGRWRDAHEMVGDVCLWCDAPAYGLLVASR